VQGGAYWAPGGSLTSEVAPVAEALLSLGLRDAAAAIIGLYFEQFVRADGSLPECDACADGGFGDALADYGEQLDIFRQVARAQLDFGGAAGAAWCAVHLPAFARLANFTLGLREQIIFPEINYDTVEKVKGLNICITTTAVNDEEGRALLQHLGMPFRH
jgi:hypothetical protein